MCHKLGNSSPGCHRNTLSDSTVGSEENGNTIKPLLLGIQFSPSHISVSLALYLSLVPICS